MVHHRQIDALKRIPTGGTFTIAQGIEIEEGLIRPFDGKADVFALGVVLHMLLTETRPFDGMADAVMEKIRTTDPPPPSMIDPALLDLDAIVARALAKNPRQRFTAQEFAAALDAI